jgi:hypothetical protein
MTTTNRTLQFLGGAYGNSNVTITATIDNVIVFNSTVATLDQEAPSTGDVTKPMPVLFSVENSDQFPVDFAGSKSMSVAVSGGDSVILDSVLCNYMLNATASNVANVATINYGNATGFIACYNGNPSNSEGTFDTRSGVAINGVVQVPDLAPKSQGTWTWAVNTGNTLTCNLNVSAGDVGNVV